MIGPFDRLERWYLAPERELLRREVEWTFRFMRGWRFLGLVAFAVAAMFLTGPLVVLAFGPLTLLAFNWIPRGIAGVVGDLFMYAFVMGSYPLNPVQPIGWLAVIWVMRRRTLRWMAPGTCRDVILSRLGPREVAATVLAAPLIAMFVFSIVEAATSILYLNGLHVDPTLWVNIGDPRVPIAWSLASLPLRVGGRALAIPIVFYALHLRWRWIALPAFLFVFVPFMCCLNWIPLRLADDEAWWMINVFSVGDESFGAFYFHHWGRVHMFLLGHAAILTIFVPMAFAIVLRRVSARLWNTMKERAALA